MFSCLFQLRSFAGAGAALAVDPGLVLVCEAPAAHADASGWGLRCCSAVHASVVAAVAPMAQARKEEKAMRITRVRSWTACSTMLLMTVVTDLQIATILQPYR